LSVSLISQVPPTLRSVNRFEFFQSLQKLPDRRQGILLPRVGIAKSSRFISLAMRLEVIVTNKRIVGVIANNRIPCGSEIAELTFVMMPGRVRISLPLKFKIAFSRRH
jgi:hypothetical protein